ncbi:protein of unknown function DUF161 [Beutenbergia cavernae DSM 12333]|uniref:Integral membrane protein n=1 Tax=Beutenbergia cavernae (strain ATCC BAA-8 / DSM 12333 / CCUG 43141 / JCM 11478 / NBRC 16432 / NCIMB 13614 / HKI 0122) TaxID=471853 RepID=C5C4E3_BEUC1|nr:membrane protein [Beutenbergia cavernae]ACQ82067.1 protein of unknown function DUF161 [Beutenbergia cavernae DSM 12333]
MSILTLSLPSDRRAERLVRLHLGLLLYGLSLAMLVESGIGLRPWDVFHDGVARLTGTSIGLVTGVVGVAVLLLWWPLRERPGIGTVSNAVVSGFVLDGAIAVLPTAHGYPGRLAYLVAGILLNGVATALYIGAGLGAGSRDGLMTGLAARTGWPLRAVRTGIEVGVLAIGWALGGTVGIGTVLYALAVGPIVHAVLPLVTPAARSVPLRPRGDVDVHDMRSRHAAGRAAIPGAGEGGQVERDDKPGCRSSAIGPTVSA